MVATVDQAAGLRTLVSGGAGPGGAEDTTRLAPVIAVASGKGGVGKTSLVVNLAVAMARLGRRVAVYDGDIGLANVDVLMGLTPRNRLDRVLAGELTLDEVIQRGPAGVMLVPGATAVPELADLSAGRRAQLADDVAALRRRADVVLVDTGAGVARGVTDFLALAGEVVVVTTPEPTALADAYALVKVAAATLTGKPCGLVVNQAESLQEAQLVAQRLNDTARRFLGLELARWWCVPHDPELARSVRRRVPLLLSFPGSPAARAILALASVLAPGKD